MLSWSRGTSRKPVTEANKKLLLEPPLTPSPPRSRRAGPRKLACNMLRQGGEALLGSGQQRDNFLVKAESDFGLRTRGVWDELGRQGQTLSPPLSQAANQEGPHQLGGARCLAGSVPRTQ